MKHVRRSLFRHEKGSTLLVALIILVALSFIGGLALTRTNFEMKLSHNDKILTRLKTRTAAVALTTAQRLENMSISDPDRLKDSDWFSTSREDWLSCGDNNSAIDASTSHSDRVKSILANLNDPTTWVTLDDLGGSPGYTNSAIFEADIGLTNTTAKDDFNDKFQDCKFRVIDLGTAGGESRRVGNNTKTMHEYYVAGYCQDGPQYHIVQLGYKARL